MTREEMLDEAVRRETNAFDRAWLGSFRDAPHLERNDFTSRTAQVIAAIRAQFRRQYEMNVCDACGSTDKYPEHLCPAKPRANPWQPS